ncbi:MAG: hypothetical protein ACRDD9_02280 [Shewanella sp.]
MAISLDHLRDKSQVNKEVVNGVHTFLYHGICRLSGVKKTGKRVASRQIIIWLHRFKFLHLDNDVLGHFTSYWQLLKGYHERAFI